MILRDHVKEDFNPRKRVFLRQYSNFQQRAFKKIETPFVQYITVPHQYYLTDTVLCTVYCVLPLCTVYLCAHPGISFPGAANVQYCVLCTVYCVLFTCVYTPGYPFLAQPMYSIVYCILYTFYLCVHPGISFPSAANVQYCVLCTVYCVLFTCVYTPGYPFLAQPIPQLTMPSRD